MDNEKNHITRSENAEYVTIGVRDLETLLRGREETPQPASKPASFGEEGQYTIDIKLAFVAILKRWWIILLATLIGGFAMLGVARYQYEPQYKATAMMYVNNPNQDGNKLTLSANSISTAKAVVTTYDVIIHTRLFLNEVDSELERNYQYTMGYTSLNGMLSTGPLEDTPIFYISAVSPEADKAMQVVNTVADCLPTKLALIIDGAPVRVVDKATAAYLISPDFSSQVTTGALVGFLLSVLYAVLVGCLLNDQLEEASWLSSTFPSIPVLAQIPDTSNGSRHHGYGYGYGRYGYSYDGYDYSYDGYGYGYEDTERYAAKRQKQKAAGQRPASNTEQNSSSTVAEHNSSSSADTEHNGASNAHINNNDRKEG